MASASDIAALRHLRFGDVNDPEIYALLERPTLSSRVRFPLRFYFGKSVWGREFLHDDTRAQPLPKLLPAPPLIHPMHLAMHPAAAAQGFPVGYPPFVPVSTASGQMVIVPGFQFPAGIMPFAPQQLAYFHPGQPQPLNVQNVVHLNHPLGATVEDLDSYDVHQVAANGAHVESNGHVQVNHNQPNVPLENTQTEVDQLQNTIVNGVSNIHISSTHDGNPNEINNENEMSEQPENNVNDDHEKVPSNSVTETENTTDNSAESEPKPVEKKPVGNVMWSSLFGASGKPNGSQTSETSKAAVNGVSHSVSEVSQDYFTERIYSRLVKFNLRATQKPLHIVPRGLNNFGNNCYINSAMQVLINLPPLNLLLQWLPNRSESDFPSTTPILDALKDFQRQFQYQPPTTNPRATRKVEFRIGDSFTIHSLVKNLSKHPVFAKGQQEDVEEFFSFILDALHEEFVSIEDIHNPEENSTQIGDIVETSENEEDDWLITDRKNREKHSRNIVKRESIISQIFGGKYCSEILKRNAKNSCTFQPFFTIQLDIDSPKVSHIVDALRLLFTRENVQQANDASITKHNYLTKLPETLILQFKLFVYNSQKQTAEKLNKLISFEESLEIPQHCVNGNPTIGSRKYKLYAVIYHHGNEIHKGHYSAAVFHTGQKIWLSYNDARIEKVEFAHVLRPQKEERDERTKVPYLVFYRKFDNMYN